MAKELTPKQHAFVREYLVDLNATQAAIRAGYSKATAGSIGQENLTKPEIAAAIELAMAKRSKRTEVTQDRVLQELARIAFGDVRKIFTDDGRLLSPGEMDDDTAAAISSVEIVTRRVFGAEEQEDQAHGGSLRRPGSEVEYVHKIKTTDKLGALTLLARHLNLLGGKDDAMPSGVVVNVNIAGPDADL